MLYLIFGMIKGHYGGHLEKSQKEFETYLGDTFVPQALIKTNIENRKNHGNGAVSEILSTLSQASLGHFQFKIALVFRDSMLISKM